MKRAWYFPAMVVVIACTLARAETGIQTVIKLVEARYSVRHHGVPGLWLARPFMIGSGVGKLKMAEFTNFRAPSEDSVSLKGAVERALGPEWHPFVETWSKSDGEWSVIFTKPNGEGLSMLVVTSEPDDGLTVLQMKLSGTALRRWSDEPLESAKHETASKRSGRDGEEAVPVTTPTSNLDRPQDSGATDR